MVSSKVFSLFILSLMIVDYFGIFFSNISNKSILVLSFIVVYMLINIVKFKSNHEVARLFGLTIVASTPLIIMMLHGIQIDLVVPLGILFLICIRTYIYRFSYSVGTVAGIIYGLFRFSTINNVIAWNIINRASHFITRPLSFGLASFGDSLGLIIPFLSITIAIIVVFGRNFRKIALYLCLFILSYVIHLVSLAYILVNFPRNNTTFIPIFLVLAAICYLVFIKDVDGDNANVDKVISIETSCIMYVSCILLALTMLFVPVNIEESTQVEAVVVGGTHSDVVSRPEYVFALGYSFTNALYGAFSIYLENSGYNISIAEDINSIDYDNADIIFLIMYNLDVEQEAGRLQSFVANGGRLVVVGDHTNIFGTTVIMNELISFSGLYIANDTTDDLLFTRRIIWNNNLYTMHNPLFTSGVRQQDFHVWGGASVGSNSLFAVPILIGRYATSDPPDLTNVGFGGYLGNRRFDFGERAGDMPLIKAISYGRGTVIVFGDSSYFQTPIVAANWRYLSAILEYSPESRVITMLKFTVILLFLVGFVFMSFRKMIITKEHLYYCYLSFMMTVLIVVLWNMRVRDNMYRQIADKRTDRFAYVNNRHFNNINTDAFDPASILGLAYNAQKNNISMMISNDLSGGIVFLIHPNKEITRQEQDEILTFIREGGVVVCTIDRRFAPAQLLSHFGIHVTSDFLGPVPWRYPMIFETMLIEFPDFRRAWGLEITNSELTYPWLTFNDNILITRTKYGDGLFYFIADADFFNMTNIEEERTGNIHNINLLRTLFSEINDHLDSGR